MPKPSLREKKYFLGSLSLPAPVRNFRATSFNGTSIYLEWDGSISSGNDSSSSSIVDRYEVYYKKLVNGSREVDDFLGNEVGEKDDITDAVVSVYFKL